jgi:hypothetical protein
MLDLDDYIVLLKILERDVRNSDVITASNIARELSAIYLKSAYFGPQKGTVERLRSMITYIKKTIPDYSEILSELIQDVIYKIENRA